MTRRHSGNMSGEQFLGNKNTKEVHDLDREDSSLSGCQINEIIAAGHDRPFVSRSTARGLGYDNCAKCLGGSTR